jgi:hypothetical protein
VCEFPSLQVGAKFMQPYLWSLVMEGSIPLKYVGIGHACFCLHPCKTFCFHYAGGCSGIRPSMLHLQAMNAYVKTHLCDRWLARCLGEFLTPRAREAFVQVNFNVHLNILSAWHGNLSYVETLRSRAKECKYLLAMDEEHLLLSFHGPYCHTTLSASVTDELFVRTRIVC